MKVFCLWGRGNWIESYELVNIWSSLTFRNSNFTWFDLPYYSHFTRKDKWESYAAAAKSLQSCPTLCDPIDGSPPGFPVPGILQARTLEWIPISFCNVWKWKVKVKSLSHVQLFETPWTAAYQAPLSTGFSRQEYWSGVPLPSLENYIWRHKISTFPKSQLPSNRASLNSELFV